MKKKPKAKLADQKRKEKETCKNTHTYYIVLIHHQPPKKKSNEDS